MPKQTKQNMLTLEQQIEFFEVLQRRFEKNAHRHKGVTWNRVQQILEANPAKLWSVSEMERTGGEPDVVVFDKKSAEIVFCDCSTESPKGRRSICYDHAGQAEREKQGIHPQGNAVELAEMMGVELLTEVEYRKLQALGEFDTKTSSWIVTPAKIRTLGGGLFCDRRYNTVFTYHNGAGSFYAARGFRGLLRIQ